LISATGGGTLSGEIDIIENGIPLRGRKRWKWEMWERNEGMGCKNEKDARHEENTMSGFVSWIWKKRFDFLHFLIGGVFSEC